MWRCPNSYVESRNHVALVDFSGEVPKIVGCVECDWDDVLHDDVGAKEEPASPRQHRCTASTQNGRRCKGKAVGDSLCPRHDGWWDRRYNSYRSPWSDISLPEAYKQVFIRAIRDAGLVADAQKVTRETFEQARRLRHSSVVYFVEREGYIKIGTTSSLRQRLKALARGSCSMPPGVKPGPVELLATTFGDRKVEGSFHFQFRSQRVGSTEWFRPNKALRSLIADLQRAEQRGAPDILDQVIEEAA